MHLSNLWTRRTLPALACLLITSVLGTLSARAESVVLEWDPNPERDLAGYKVYTGLTAGSYSQVQNVGLTNRVALNDLSLGATYYFVVTAYNTSGLESDPSNEVSYQPIAKNPPPLPLNLVLEVLEDTQLPITLQATDTSDATLFYGPPSQPANGQLLGTAPNLTYLPNPDFHGTDGFQYPVSDGINTAYGTVTITVLPVNDPPVALPQSLSAVAGTGLPITLTATDAEKDPASFRITRGPANGTLAGAGASWSYTGNRTFSGSDSFEFVANDGRTDGNPAVVSLTVAPRPNTAPVPAALSLRLDEDSSVTATVSATDAEGDPVTFTLVTPPAYGSLAWNPPSVVYTPAANYSGPDSFVYRASDGSLSATATATIQVNPVNDPPVAQSRSYTVVAGTPIAVTPTATDVDQDALTFRALSGPAHGTLAISGGTWTYTSSASYSGSDSITFVANDGSADSAQAVISITVTPSGNKPPVPASISITLAEDTSKAVTLSATDPEKDPITFSIVSGPSYGTLSGTIPNLTYRPATNYFGPDSFVYRASDGKLTADATVTITVNNVNDAPVALAQALGTDEEAPLELSLIARDPDGDALTSAITRAPTKGKLSGSGTNFLYTPTKDKVGPDYFTFTVSDGKLTSTAARVDIMITNVNDAPVITSQTLTVNEDSSVAFALKCYDVDQEKLRYFINPRPAFGSFLGTSPNLRYIPNPNYSGPDYFDYCVADLVVTTEVVRVYITVNPVNDAPTAVAETVAVTKNTPRSFTLKGNDIDGDPLRFLVYSQPANGKLSGTAPALTYTPAAGFVGKDSFGYRVADGSSTSAVATITFNVTAPLSTSDGDTTDPAFEKASPIIVVLPGGSSSQLASAGGSLASLTTEPNPTFVLGEPPAHGEIALQPDGSFTYRHGGDAALSDTFTVITGGSSGLPASESRVSVSILRVVDGSVAADQTELTFSVATGLRYVVEFQDGTIDPAGPWSALTELTGEVDGTATITDRSVSPETVRYYRVRWVGSGTDLTTDTWVKPAVELVSEPSPASLSLGPGN